MPAGVLAGLDARKFYFLTAFRARLLTAVQTNGSGKGELSSLVKDGADETRLAATDGPINRTLQPFWAPGDAFVRIDPVAAEKNVVASNMSARGDWDSIHFKEENNTGIFFPGCNNPRFTGVDRNPCIDLHENRLNRTPGVNTTYSKGQKVLWYDLVFRAGAEESPNHASSIDNGEALGTPLGGGVTPLGKDLVL